MGQYRILKNGRPTIDMVETREEAFSRWRDAGYAEATKFTPTTMREKGIPFQDDAFVNPNTYDWLSLEKVE